MKENRGNAKGADERIWNENEKQELEKLLAEINPSTKCNHVNTQNLPNKSQKAGTNDNANDVVCVSQHTDKPGVPLPANGGMMVIDSVINT